jgi:hypothetical protein
VKEKQSSPNEIRRATYLFLTQGGIAVGGPPKKLRKIAEKCGIAEILRKNCGFFLREIAVGTEKIFGSQQWTGKRGAKKLQVQTRTKPSRKFFFTYLWSIFTNFDKKMDVQSKKKLWILNHN